MSDSVSVSKVTLLHRVAVIELAAAEGGDFAEAIEVASTRARIIVIDALHRAVLPHPFIDALSQTQTELSPQGGHLIVVNVPDDTIADLRFLGIDAATTTDLRFEMPSRAHV
jgi:hypothetical protein